MDNFVDKLDDEMGYYLEEIKFTRYEKESETNNMTVNDSYEIIDKTEDELVLQYQRQIDIEGIFGLIVKINVRRHVDDSEKDKFKISDIKDQDIEENIDDILGPSLSHVSNIIANITGACGFTPYISPPAYLKNKKRNRKSAT